MTTCERCGREIPENVAICPSCGTVTPAAQPMLQPHTRYEPFPQNDSPPAPQLGQYPAPLQQPGYGQPYQSPFIYRPASVHVHITANNTTPLVVEVLLSLLLGIYGIGWLMTGETVVGFVLLICSFLLYWPLVIVSLVLAFFTVGLSLLCSGPLIIGAIVFNAVMLNNALKRRTARYTMAQPK